MNAVGFFHFIDAADDSGLAFLSACQEFDLVGGDQLDIVVQNNALVYHSDSPLPILWLIIR